MDVFQGMFLNIKQKGTKEKNYMFFGVKKRLRNEKVFCSWIEGKVLGRSQCVDKRVKVGGNDGSVLDVEFICKVY